MADRPTEQLINQKTNMRMYREVTPPKIIMISSRTSIIMKNLVIYISISMPCLKACQILDRYPFPNITFGVHSNSQNVLSHVRKICTVLVSKCRMFIIIGWINIGRISASYCHWKIEKICPCFTTSSSVIFLISLTSLNSRVQRWFLRRGMIHIFTSKTRPPVEW